MRHLCHERDELRATSSSLTVELQQAGPAERPSRWSGPSGGDEQNAIG